MIDMTFLPENPRYLITRCGRVFSVNARGGSKERVTPVHRAHPGAVPYRMVDLIIDGKTKTVKVSKLVMMCFGPPKPFDKACIAHRNGNSLDDHIDNLKWATYTENNRDRVAHGTMPRGSKQSTAKLTEENVREIRSKENLTIRNYQFARRFGVTQTLIHRVRTRQAWKHVE